MGDDAAKAAEVNLIAENAQLLRDWHDALSRAESAESTLADARRDLERLREDMKEILRCDYDGRNLQGCHDIARAALERT